MMPVEIMRGDSPVVLGMPHTGTWLPDELATELNDRGRALTDTDWHIDQLYDGLLPDATTVRATFHRYVIDANRDPTGQSLYPSQNTTGLVPLTDFDGAPIWNSRPDSAEIERRRATFHAPYHAALQAELERAHRRHGVAILYDCHSIRSVIPHLFERTLPVLNIGTNHGSTCAAEMEQIVHGICAASSFETVLNGRFVGGWTTRHYGRPNAGFHAIQMEIAQRAYLSAEAPPWDYSHTVAAPLRALLGDILAALHVRAKESGP